LNNGPSAIIKRGEAQNAKPETVLPAPVGSGLLPFSYMQAQPLTSNERIGIIAIHYIEGDPETYKRVTLSIGDDEFSWYTPPQMAYDAALEMAEAYGVKVAHSSSIDNYKMDGGLLLA